MAALKARLLASTYYTPPPYGAWRPFGTSAFTAERYKFASEGDLLLALERFAQLTGFDAKELAPLAKQSIHQWQLHEFQRLLPRLESRAGEDILAKTIRKFFAGQLLSILLADPLNQAATYPPIVSSILSEAADGLFEFAHTQFVALSHLAKDLVDWLKERGFSRVVLIESPLGNCVPVGVIARLAEARGINLQVLHWGFPRNASVGRGYNVREAARRAANEELIASADCILLVDDVLTGSRLIKIAEALRQAIGRDRFFTVAMHFDFPNDARMKPFNKRDLTRFDEWARDQGLPHGNVKFPSLSVFKVDHGAPVVFETALAWGESDLIAGKRKVNLLFNFIDHYECIVRDLATPDSRYRPLLRDLVWIKDTLGNENFIVQGVVEAVLSEIFRKLSIDQLFADIRAAAAATYPDDYFGIGAALDKTEFKKRSDWLDHCISIHASRQLTAQESNILARAVRDVHTSGLDSAHRRVNPNHAYGHYALPYNSTVRTLHTTLCDLILAVLSSLDEKEQD